MKPIIKWAGGKRRLFPEIRKRIPSLEDKIYIEPFLGGGAIAFELAPPMASLSDSNFELINMYCQIRNCPLDVYSCLINMHASEESYYKIRAWDVNSHSPAELAARTIFLNKMGFNGLFRVNSRGVFNVPYGKRKKVCLPSIIDISQMSHYLNNSFVSLECGDFDRDDDRLKKNQFWYLDPPYAPTSPSKRFVEYTQDGFDIHDQYRLYELCKRIDRVGGMFLLSNSRTPMTLELYRDFKIETVENSRSISCKGNSRKKVKEILVSNYTVK